MTATLYSLNRHRDISGVSGEGDDIATICEFPSGLIALHWNSKTPSVTVYTDIRHVTALHGHGGASTLEHIDNARLLAAYQRVVPFLLKAQHRKPLLVGPHPDHPDRLRLVFDGEAPWRFFIALFDGSTHAATHEDLNGEIEHRWISADGNLWLVWYSAASSKHPDNSPYDDRD